MKNRLAIDERHFRRLAKHLLSSSKTETDPEEVTLKEEIEAIQKALGRAGLGFVLYPQERDAFLRDAQDLGILSIAILDKQGELLQHEISQLKEQIELARATDIFRQKLDSLANSIAGLSTMEVSMAKAEALRADITACQTDIKAVEAALEERKAVIRAYLGEGARLVHEMSNAMIIE